MSADVYRLYYVRYRLAFRLGSYLGFIRGFCAAPIAPYLLGEGKLSVDTERRLADARNVIRDFIHKGLEASESKAHFNRMRLGHAGVSLPEEHFLYVIANFYLEPLRVKRILGGSVTATECKMLCRFWCDVARSMGLRNIPSNYIGWLTLRRNYERRFGGTSKGSVELLNRCMQSMLGLSIPFGLRTFARAIIVALLPLSHKAWLEQRTITGRFYLRVLIWRANFRNR
ncbi:hypothetical protein [Marinagarivorans cellulosilyticus]|uniref:ER-bound oxygenase mpaB/mpaB'/Rubber oxygenase catalytic domain-containing protein n=1 Tax=Marinagarivorans cellulosilyticus TaxID=2721545 RepID=A0AAN2BLA7_9GAMM|nr:hypothetical protein [Marinagarivorans cellulosilyticus]BCD98820.1 hypothetical protein MARGE09_P3021 [Marinagarivorans cellulosilyticus]